MDQQLTPSPDQAKPAPRRFTAEQIAAASRKMLRKLNLTDEELRLLLPECGFELYLKGIDPPLTPEEKAATSVWDDPSKPFTLGDPFPGGVDKVKFLR